MNQLITKGEGVPDFILLETISEDAVVENLRTRYAKNIIYVRSTPAPVCRRGTPGAAVASLSDAAR